MFLPPLLKIFVNLSIEIGLLCLRQTSLLEAAAAQVSWRKQGTTQEPSNSISDNLRDYINATYVTAPNQISDQQKDRLDKIICLRDIEALDLVIG
jgi:hypothetical protein